MNNILNGFIDVLRNSYGNLIDEANWILGTLITLEMVFFGLWWAMGADNRIVQGIKKLLKFGFWIWLVTAFPAITNWFLGSFIEAGFRAVGYAGSPSILMNPASMMDHYFIASEPIINAIEGLSMLTQFGTVCLFGLSLIVLMIAYLVMAAQIFLVTIEYYIVCAVAVILLPFGVFKPTGFLGEKAIGAIVSFAIKFMVLALLLGLANPVLSTLVPPDNVDINDAVNIMAATALIGFLIWNAPGVAAGLLSGSPSLTAGTAAQNVLAGAMLAGLGMKGAVGATQIAAGGARTAGALGTRMAGAAFTQGQLAYATASKLPALAAVAGGLKGASTSLVRSTMGRMNDAIGRSAAANFRIGSRSAFRGSGGRVTAGMRRSDYADRSGYSSSLAGSVSMLPSSAAPAMPQTKKPADQSCMAVATGRDRPDAAGASGPGGVNGNDGSNGGGGTALKPADRVGALFTGGSGAPDWASNAMRAMRAMPQEAKPAGGSPGVKLRRGDS